MQITRTNLKQSGLPKSLWNFAAIYASIQMNMWPRKYCNKKGETYISTPWERIYKTPPDVDMLKPFGCDAFAHILKKRREDKLSDRSFRGVFIGIPDGIKGYLILNPENNEVVITKDVKFIENKFSYAKQVCFSKSTKPKENCKKDTNTSVGSFSRGGDENILEDDPTKGKTTFVPETTKDSEKNSNDDDLDLDSITSGGELDEPETETETEGSESEGEADDENNNQPNTPNIEEREEITEFGTTSEGGERDSDQTIPTTQPRRSERLKTALPPQAYWKISQTCLKEPEPKTYKQAVSSEEKIHWKDAMETELNNLEKLSTWEVIEKPRQSNIIKSKWVFKKKTRNGFLERYKARLVAKGFTQKQGEDYDETFAPVARHTTTRLVIADAARKGRKLIKADIEAAYLNAPVLEDIYLEIPQGLSGHLQQDLSGKCLKLKKSLYGLKQSARNWYECLTEWLREQKFTPSDADPCLFINEEIDAKVLIYVDDTLIDIPEKFRDSFKKNLEARFKLSEYQMLDWHLGLQIHQDENGISISQTSYIERISEMFKLSDKTKLTPTTNQRLPYPEKEEITTHQPYRQLVGCLLWVSIMTRPDITFAVHDLSRHNTHPTNQHWTAAIRTLQYLKTTKDLKLFYPRNNTAELKGYSDSDWMGDTKDSKSTSGYIFTFNGTPICWNSMKQRRISLSTCEAEYKALGEAVKESRYLRKLSKEMNIPIESPTLIQLDNVSTICISENPALHKRTKHILADFNFIREAVREVKDIRLKYIPTNINPADIFTKPLIGEKFRFHRNKMFLRSPV